MSSASQAPRPSIGAPAAADAGARMDGAVWRHRIARNVRIADRMLLCILAGAGMAAVGWLADWWFRRTHVADPVLFVALSLAFWYGVSRIVLGWANYVAMATPEPRAAPPGLRVAVFVTSAAGEPLAMFDKTLSACARIAYPHTTYLLDDTRDSAFRDLAARHGVVWLELLDVPGAKAGKINRALELTSEEFILVLDPDHVPFPEFLDRVLGHFADDRVGFVQVAQAYYNQARSFIASGAAEQTYAFYGPGQMGLYGHGASVAIGANCTFRRSALASIGGHGIGLAEDLVTAIRLHAAGWRSVYVPEIVSRGLVPEDLGSFYRQQLKWARGVYEVAFTEVPRLFRRLSWRQRLAYTTIGTYYLSGVSTAVFLVFPYLYLWTGAQPASMRFEDFLNAVAPVAVAGCLMYAIVQRWLCDPAREGGVHWRGLVLKAASWHVFLLGTILADAGAESPYAPTPKSAVRGRFLRLAWPSIALLALFAITLLRVLYRRVRMLPEGALELSAEAVWGMVAFALLPVLGALAAIGSAWRATRPLAGAPWDRIEVERLGGRPS
jgi:cellulose synthase (UDP-forming)